MKIVVLYKKFSGCDYHRLLLPFSHLETSKGDSVMMIDNEAHLRHDVLWDADFIIFNRVCTFDLDILITWKKVHGYTYQLVCDLDDYWYLNPTHEYYEMWRKTDHSKQIEDHLRLSDVVTVTHERLAEKVKKFNPNVYILPNSLPYDEGQFTSKKNVIDGNIRVLYTGGTSHYADLKSIKAAICKVRNLPMDFIIAGYNRENKKTEEFWTRIGNIISCNPNSYLKEGLPLDTYMDHLNIANLTMAPLEENTFTWGKSTLKIIESGCKNLPIVCSNTYPYTSFKDVEGVYLCKNTKEWTQTFTHIYNNPQEAISSGIALGKYVRENYNLTDVNKSRYQILKALSGKRMQISITPN